MSDDYKALKLELFEKLSEIEMEVKDAEQASGKFPIPASKELRYVGRHYLRAEKELSEKHEEKAYEELKEALNHARRAVLDMLEFRFLFYSKFANAVIDEFKRSEDLASEHIENYEEHSENLSEIMNTAENAELPDNASPEAQASYRDRIKKIQAFLSDFEKGKDKLFEAINERMVNRFLWNAR